MANLIDSLPQHPINEYKLILVPHEDLNLKIIKVRKEFAAKFGVEKTIMAMPEILLAGFKQYQMAEARMVNRLRIIAMSTGAIKIDIKNFSSLPAHSIFLQVTSKLALATLSKKIREGAQQLMKINNEQRPFFPTDFYFTVANKLKPWQYEKAWLEYSSKQFTGKFIAGRMLLLKRKTGEFKYKPVENFEFLNLPVETKQGLLF